MPIETVEILRQLFFWLQRILPQYQEVWMYFLNWLANFG